MSASTRPIHWRETFPKDLMASFVVFLVALPLCMGVAIASGVPPAMGLITGIVGGIIVGLIAGSPLQVSGPAAGLTVLVFEIVQTHGLAVLGAIVFGAGLIQMLAGALKLGRWFSAISPAVVNGMLAGIGALIIAAQVHVMVDDTPRGSGLANLAAIPEAIWKGIVPLDGSAHHLAAAVGVGTMALMLAWGYVPKQLKIIPAPLVGVTAAALVAALFNLPIKYVNLPESLVGSIQWTGWAELARLTDVALLTSVVTVAIIASAESLLCATAVDRLHNGSRHNPDREMLAQGVGNAICGILGALPMTGVIVRSSANVQAGGVTRVSTMLHGTWILLFVLLAPWLLQRIPLTALAALLVYTGFKLLAPSTIKTLLPHGRTEVAIYLSTTVAIVATNLLEGILIGVGLALLKQLWVLSRIEVTVEHDPLRNEARLRLRGAATFVSIPKIKKALDSVPEGARVIVDGGNLSYIDHACMELFADWEQSHRSAGEQGQVDFDWDGLRRLQRQTGPIGQEKSALSSVR